MKIIDLLNKIGKGEEVPQKIKFENNIYKYYKEQRDYFVNIDGSKFRRESLLYNIMCSHLISEILETEVEIIIDEILIGDFARNKEGKIIKVGCVGHAVVIDDKDNITFSKLSGEIVKYSSDIKDIVELGDYVNGKEVVLVNGCDIYGNDKEEKGVIETRNGDAYGEFLEDIEIKSIVTKEQLRNCEYRLEV